MRVLPSSSSSSVGKQSQLLLKPTEVELGLQVGVEFDNRKRNMLKMVWLSVWVLLSLISYITWHVSTQAISLEKSRSIVHTHPHTERHIHRQRHTHRYTHRHTHTHRHREKYRKSWVGYVKVIINWWRTFTRWSNSQEISLPEASRSFFISPVYQTVTFYLLQYCLKLSSYLI